MASLWISLGSLWVTPQFTVTHVAPDGPVLVCHPQPGSALPPSSLPQAPQALPVSALLWGVQPSPYVFLSAHLWPVWPPSPGSAFLSLLSRRYAGMSTFCVPPRSLFSPSLSLSSQPWGFSSVPREPAGGHSSKCMAC